MTLRGLRDAYLKENPSAMVTIKSQNFEAIRGHDHMRLDANFAEYVIRKMTERM